MAVTKLFGASVKRREDPRLITGKGVYTDDIRLPGMSYMAVLRSPYAHAKITRLDTSRAAEMPGVILVLTASDLEGKLGGMPTAWLVPNSNLKTPVYPALAKDKVRYVGDGVAVVVAESIYQAQDAIAAIDVEYEPLPVIVNQEQAVQDGAPQLHDDVPNNIAFTFNLNSGDVAAAAVERDVVTVKQRFINQRLIPAAMETRGAVASWSPGTDELTLWNTSQNPHIARLLISLTLGIPENKVRVISRDVGGGFGSKIPYCMGEALAIIASRSLNRPVKWIEDRRENFVATTHGRDHIQDVEVTARRDGTITAIKVKAWANMGAYLSTAAPGVPTWLFALMITGPYDIKNLESQVVGVFTNTTPTDAYRGAGRPEATYLIERMIDLVANALNMDPIEIRRKNLVAADRFPWTSPVGLLYDSGNYQGTLDKALALVGYDNLLEQQAASANGKRIGIGFSTYVEVCGLAPSAAAGAMGFQGGLWESAVVRMHPTGKVTVLTGSSPHGQGEETTFAQIVNGELGVPVEDVEVVHGDTNAIPFGMGTYGSRSTAVGGSALIYAARKVRDKAAKIAAHLLEVSPDDLDFEDGKFTVRGAPDKVKSIQEIALASYLAWSMPEGVTPGLDESHFHDPTNNTFPFGCHICVTEVDTETGEVKILRYVAVDDVGNLINPMIVEGQIHGGLAQGIGQALYEWGAYDENGQLLTGTFADYAMPRADLLPHFELGGQVTPSPSNPMGMKGVGETGTIASTPAVINSIVNALSSLGITHIDMPATPERIWNAIQAAGHGR